MTARAGETLRVFLGNEAVGSLERRGPSRYRFSYDGSEGGGSGRRQTQLSQSLPPEAERFAPAEAAPFFEGLLPEGAVRAAIAGSFHLSEEDGFGMLAALGADCAGAVSVRPDEDGPPDPARWEYRRLAEDDMELLVEELPRNPLGVDPRPEGVRLSLGGLQPKLVLAADVEGFSQPLHGAPSNCLLKPELGRYDGIVVNEEFCMRVARSVGLRAARTTIAEVGKTPCLRIERFDRAFSSEGSITRIHQEDLCQATGVLPAGKYEDNGGPSVASTAGLIRSLPGTFGARDLNDFVLAVHLNFMLGNSDAHGKNFALLYEDVGVRLAPLYDLVSTAAYPELTTRMAMAIGGVEDPAEVDMAAWATLAAECELGRGIEPIVRRRTRMILRIVEDWRVAAVRDGWHRPIIDRVVEICRERAAQLL